MDLIRLVADAIIAARGDAIVATDRVGIISVWNPGAEAVWWRCHRRVIADYLFASGFAVFHILGPGKIEVESVTPAARLTTGGIVSADLPEPDLSSSAGAASRHIL